MLNDTDTTTKIVAFILISVLGLGVFMQFLNNLKLDDLPAEDIGYVLTVTSINPSFIGTSSTTTTTF